MPTLNAFLPVILETFNARAKQGTNSELLGIHEALTKLWIATVHGVQAEKEKRIANVLIGTYFVAHQLGITDVESCLTRRLEEWKRDNPK